MSGILVRERTFGCVGQRPRLGCRPVGRLQDEVAIITRPGVQARRSETSAIAHWLASVRPLRQIESPGTLDGGDVLVVGRSIFVGASDRTNAAGAA